MSRGPEVKAMSPAIEIVESLRLVASLKTVKSVKTINVFLQIVELVRSS